MRCAVVDNETGAVVNVIVADADKDKAPEGCFLVNLFEKSRVDVSWTYDFEEKNFYYYAVEEPA